MEDLCIFSRFVWISQFVSVSYYCYQLVASTDVRLVTLLIKKKIRKDDKS